MLGSARPPGAMISVPEQTATILEFVLLFVGIGYLVWLFLSPGGRAVRLRAPALMPWHLEPAGFFLLAWLVVALTALGLVLVPVAFGADLRSRPDGRTLELIVSGSMFPVGAILTYLLVRLVRRRTLQGSYDSDRRRPFGGGLRGGFLTFLAAVPLVTGTGLVWGGLLQLLGLPTAHQELVDYFAEARSPALLGTMITLALVIAPIGEELVFRAGLFRYLRTRVPRWLAFSLSAGVFAILHLNWVSFLPLFVLGVIFAVAYERTGRVAVPILAHALFNLNTLLLVLSQAPI